MKGAPLPRCCRIEGLHYSETHEAQAAGNRNSLKGELMELVAQ